MGYYSDVTLAMRKQDAIKLIPILTQRGNQLLKMADDIKKCKHDTLLFRWYCIKWYGTEVDEMYSIMQKYNFPYYLIRLGEEDSNIAVMTWDDGSYDQQNTVQTWSENLYVTRDVTIEGNVLDTSFEELAATTLSESISVEDLI